MRTFVLLLLVSTALAAQSTRTACEVTGEAAATLRALPSLSDLSRSWEERMSPRRALAKQEPTNWPLQIALQDPILRAFHVPREWDEALAQYRSMPDRALGQVLEARLLAGFQRQRSHELLQQALAAAPDSPWVQLAMLERAAHPLSQERDTAARHFEAVRRLCPLNTRVFLHLDVVRDLDRFGFHLQTLRQRIEGRKKAGLTEGDMTLFRPAWTWEAVVAGAGGDREAFLKTVTSDLTALRALALYDSGEWFSLIRWGYEQTVKDKAALAGFQEEILKRAPRSQAAWWIEDERARRSGETSLSKIATLMRERLGRFGEHPAARFGLRAIIHDPASLTGEFERAADLLLGFESRHPDQGFSTPPTPIQVAGEYAKRKIRLDLVPDLIDEGLQQAEYQEKYRRGSDVIPAVPNRVDGVTAAQRRSALILIRHALATGQLERARMLLADFRNGLNAGPQADWNYHEYLDLAKEAGVPAAAIPTATPRAAERFPVHEFAAKDLSGRTWGLADLKGKVALVNIWTTWCGPCRAEMPGLQKLFERWKDRKDRVVLTISADAHADLARAFVQEHGYQFPVIHGQDVAAKFFPPVYFPQNWLIDPTGRRLNNRPPPPGDSTLDQIEELANQAAKQAP